MALALAAAVLPGRRTDRSRRGVLLAAGALVAAGLGLGLREGGRAAGSCTAALRTGDGVTVEGELVMAVRPPAPDGRSTLDRWSRFELLEARLGRSGRVCGAPRVLVRIPRPAAGLRAGSRIRVVGEWRRYAPAGRPALRAVGRYGAVYGTLAPAPAAASGRAGIRPLRAARARAGERLARLLPPDAVPAAKALVLAERSELAPEVSRRFTDAGMIHLLAISGLHVGLLAGGALWIAGLFLGRRARWPVAALVTGTYVALIGAPPAAVRAALLFAGLSATRVRGSPARPGDLLGWAAAASLLASPLLLVNPGFQLSFAGFAGLLGGDRAAVRMLGGRRGRGAGGRWRRSLDRRTRTWGRALAASAGAFLFTAPIAAAHFGRVAPASILSSLAGAPLVALALAGLLPALVLPGPVAALLGAGAAVPIRGLLGLAEWFAGLPLHGAAAPPDILAWSALALGGAGVAALLSVERENRAARARGALGLAAAVALWTSGPGLRTVGGGGTTLLCSLDVGQGDAAVLRTRRGHWIVFDAGPGPGFGGRGAPLGGDRTAGRGDRTGPPVAGAWDAGTRVLVPFLRRRGARAVDLFVLSHPHLDHLGGAAALFEAFPVRRVLDAGTPLPSGAYLRYLGEVEAEGARWLPARPGARLRLDEVEVLVLGPGGVRGTTPDAVSLDPNDVSVALRVRVGERFVYVNTGDAPAAAEAEILRRWPADSLRADLLKLGHHGSRTSTSGAWLAATRPEIALLSVGGRNRYGHPHPSTLARLDSAGVPRVWRTDRQGTLCVEVGKEGRWEMRPE